MPLASVALDEARVLLNDAGAKLYKNTILLPVLRKAYRELQQKLADNGISTSREQSDDIDIPAGTVSIVFGAMAPAPAIPTNLLYPIALQEKKDGEDDTKFIGMSERPWIENQTPEERIRSWSWREDSIFLGTSNIDNVVRIRFWGSLEAIDDETFDIPILDCETFLAARTAAIAAFAIGGAPDRAALIQSDADDALVTLISRNVKNRQALPVRRRPFKAFRYRPFLR